MFISSQGQLELWPLVDFPPPPLWLPVDFQMLCSGEAQVLQQHQLSGCTPTLRSFLLVCKVLEDMGGGGGIRCSPSHLPSASCPCLSGCPCLFGFHRESCAEPPGGGSCRQTLRGGLTAADSGSAVRTHALLLVITCFLLSSLQCVLELCAQWPWSLDWVLAGCRVSGCSAKVHVAGCVLGKGERLP